MVYHDTHAPKSFLHDCAHLGWLKNTHLELADKTVKCYWQGMQAYSYSICIYQQQQQQRRQQYCNRKNATLQMLTTKMCSEAAHEWLVRSGTEISVIIIDQKKGYDRVVSVSSLWLPATCGVDQVEQEALTSMCTCSTSTVKDSSGCVILGMPKSRKMTKQVDGHNSQHKCFVSWKTWSVEELETLLVGTKPRPPHHRSPGERHRKRKCLTTFLERMGQSHCHSGEHSLLEDLKYWGAWDITSGDKAKATTPLITWRDAQKQEVFDNLPWKDGTEPLLIRWTLEPFQSRKDNVEEISERWGGALQSAENTILDWTELKMRVQILVCAATFFCLSLLLGW